MVGAAGRDGVAGVVSAAGRDEVIDVVSAVGRDEVAGDVVSMAGRGDGVTGSSSCAAVGEEAMAEGKEVLGGKSNAAGSGGGMTSAREGVWVAREGTGDDGGESPNLSYIDFDFPSYGRGRGRRGRFTLPDPRRAIVLRRRGGVSWPG